VQASVRFAEGASVWFGVLQGHLPSITVCRLKGNCEAVHVIKTCDGVEVDVHIFSAWTIAGTEGLILYPGHVILWIGTSVD
jgi:hypothetical protein